MAVVQVAPIDPLNHDVPIVDARGRPTPQFIQQWQKSRQVSLTVDETVTEVGDLSEQLAGKSDIGHTHDDRYFTEAESDARYAALVHNHDDRYFTEAESDARYAAVVHVHAAADITSGTFADARVAQSNVTQHQAALSIAGSQLTGNILHARLPNVSGTWDVGNANTNTINSVSHRFQIAGTEIARLTSTGLAIDRTGAGFDPLVALHIRRATGTAVIDPVAIRLHTTSSAGDWVTTMWGQIQFWSDDANTPGASTRASFGAYSANTAGSQTGLQMYVSTGATFYKAFQIDPSNGAQSFIAAPGSNANMLGVIPEDPTSFARYVATTGGVVATEIIGELRFEPTVVTPSPLEGSLVVRLNAGDNMQTQARFTRAGTLALATSNAAPGTGIAAGLDVHNGSLADHVLQFRGNGIAHGMTDIAATEVWGSALKISTSQGGFDLRGFTEGKPGLRLASYATNDDLTRSTAGIAPITLEASKKSGTTVAAHANNANLVAISSNGSARYLFGYSSLYVAHAAALPTASGVNGWLLYGDADGFYARSALGTITTIALP